MPKSANMRRKSRRFRHLPLYRAIHPRKPAASATEAGPVCRDHRSDPGRGWQTAWEAAAHVEADLRASARRTRLRGRSDHREGFRVGAPSASTPGIRSVPRRFGGLSTRHRFHGKQPMTLEAFVGEGAVQRARRTQPPWSLRAEDGRTGRPLRHLEATKFLVASASRLPLDPDDATQASPGPAVQR